MQGLFHGAQSSNRSCTSTPALSYCLLYVTHDVCRMQRLFHGAQSSNRSCTSTPALSYCLPDVTHGVCRKLQLSHDASSSSQPCAGSRALAPPHSHAISLTSRTAFVVSNGFRMTRHLQVSRALAPLALPCYLPDVTHGVCRMQRLCMTRHLQVSRALAPLLFHRYQKRPFSRDVLRFTLFCHT